MDWLLLLPWLLGVAIVMRLTAGANPRARLRRRLKRYRPATTSALPGGQLWLHGTALPGPTLLQAPLSGQQVIAWRLIVAQRWFSLSGIETARELLDLEASVDFRLRDAEGEALVCAGPHTELLAAPPLTRSFPDGWHAIPHDLRQVLEAWRVFPAPDNQGEVFVRWVELGVPPGQPLYVAGQAQAEADPRATGLGYREAPVRLSLSGSPDEPILLTDTAPRLLGLMGDARRQVNLKQLRRPSPGRKLPPR